MYVNSQLRAMLRSKVATQLSVADQAAERVERGITTKETSLYL